MCTKQLLCLIINKNILVLAFSAGISHFKLPIYFHEIWKGLECQRGNQHSLTLAPQWEDHAPSRGHSNLLAQVGTPVLAGPGLSWAANLSGFSSGPAAEKETKAAFMPLLTKQALGQGSEDLPVSSLPLPPTQLSAPPQPLGTGEGQRRRHRETRYVMPGMKALKECCLVAMKWR